MIELEKGMRIAALLETQQEALPRFEDQIRAWDIALPPVPPLVLDFGLGDFYRVGLIEPWTYHSFTGAGPALLLEVSKPCIIDDNYFEDTRILIGGNYVP